MFVVRLNDTIMTTDYAHRYFQQGRLDFLVTIDDSYYERLYLGSGSFKGAVDVINDNFASNDIPARISVKMNGSAIFRYEGGETIDDRSPI